MNSKKISILIGLMICMNVLNTSAQLFDDYSTADINHMIIKEDPTARSGKYLALKDSGSVVWTVDVAHSAYYSINFRYRAFGGSKAQHLLKNKQQIPIGFAMAEQWNEFSQPFHLVQGENTIGLDADWGNMDIDYMQIKACEVSPRIYPLKQTVYKTQPRRLRYKIDNFKKSIRSVMVDDTSIEYETIMHPYQEKSIWIDILEDAVEKFDPGKHTLRVMLEDGMVESLLEVNEDVLPHGMTILAPDVEHGAAVFIQLPGNKNLLIDSGKKWVRDRILIPMLKRNGIDTIHTFILTHYHGDHDSGDRGKTIINTFHVQEVHDYQSVHTGEIFNIDDVELKILNSYENGKDENTRSLAFTLSYNGFVYNHGGDTYAVNQQRMMEEFRDDNRAQVYFANHHFHGSVLPEYIQLVDPDLVLLQAQEAVYARSAYMEDYLLSSEQFLNRKRETPIESIFALELGATVISVVDGENWWYSTYKNQHEVVFPEFMKEE